MNKLRLDDTDKKILLVLLKNGRISISELARIIKRNYVTVWNRVNKLIEIGVIKHFYPVVQLPGIGARRYMSVYLNLKNITEEKQQEIFKELCKNPFIIEVCELRGRWNVSLLLVTNYIKEAYGTLNFIQQLCKGYLNDLIVMPTYTISNLNRKFFTEGDIEVNNVKTGYAPLINKTPLIHLSGALNLSKEDIEILDYMKLNSRATLDEISKKLNVHLTLIDYRIKKMISENLIKYFTIEIDSTKLGYEQYLLFLNLNGSEKDKQELIKDLETIKQGYHYFQYLNYWEIVATFTVKNMDEMNKIFFDLQNKYKNAINDHELVRIIKKHKSESYPDVKNIYSSKLN